MTIIGHDTRYCGCCEARTNHVKVLIDGKIFFFCAEKHGDHLKGVLDDRQLNLFQNLGILPKT